MNIHTVSAIQSAGTANPSRRKLLLSPLLLPFTFAPASVAQAASSSDLIADEWALRRLAYLYARAMDSNEPKILDEIFADDAVLLSRGAVHDKAFILGIPAILKRDYASCMHAVHNQTVTINGDTAEGETYSIAYELKHPKDGKYTREDLGIRYQDKFVRRNGKWRFLRRQLNIEWAQIVETGGPIPAAPVR